MIYIIDQTSISPQHTFDNAIFEGLVNAHEGTRYLATEPDYAGIIPAGLLRRMGKAVRMGVGSGLQLLQRHPNVQGIILGTANGGLEDCLKFLNQIVDYNEGTLTPTNFVQSTPNAVAGNLALTNKITGYNMTHVHKGLAFENALLDASLLLQEGKYTKLLVGSIEEISQYNYNIDSLNGFFKLEETSSESLLTSDTAGSVNGEGASWFVVSDEPGEGSFAEVVDMSQTANLNLDEVEDWISAFLRKNNYRANDIDLLLNGRSGDKDSDGFYNKIEDSLFADTSVATFKNLVGEYPTATAFAVWIASHLLNGESIPEKMIWQGMSPNGVGNILIYNHFRAEQHSLILLKRGKKANG